VLPLYRRWSSTKADHKKLRQVTAAEAAAEIPNGVTLLVGGEARVHVGVAVCVCTVGVQGLV